MRLTSPLMDIATAKELLDRAEQNLEKAPERDAIIRLLGACQATDVLYKEYCNGIDEANGDPIGESYELDPNIEFYIDTSAWHTISEALRELGYGAEDEQR